MGLQRPLLGELFATVWTVVSLWVLVRLLVVFLHVVLAQVRLDTVRMVAFHWFLLLHKCVYCGNVSSEVLGQNEALATQQVITMVLLLQGEGESLIQVLC